MRRAPIVITTTIAGMAGVLSFNAREPTFSVASSATGTPNPVTTTATPSAGASGSNSGSATGSGQTADSGAATSDAGTAASGAKDGTYTGDVIPTQYGNAEVQVTISGGEITKVAALQLQANEPKSVQISTGAEPSLQASALSKQSGAIDAVSGATITSASYEASLQSALDKAGFEAADGSKGSSEIPQVEEHGDRGGFR